MLLKNNEPMPIKQQPTNKPLALVFAELRVCFIFCPNPNKMQTIFTKKRYLYHKISQPKASSYFVLPINTKIKQQTPTN
jgi:hypothetical protein